MFGNLSLLPCVLQRKIEGRWLAEPEGLKRDGEQLAYRLRDER